MMNKTRQSVCVIAAHVVVMHAAALTLMVVSSAPIQPPKQLAQSKRISLMHARLSPGTAAEKALPTVAQTTEPSEIATVPAAPATAEVPALPGTPEPPLAQLQEQTPSNVESEPPVAATDPGDDYLPRPLLSTPPRSSAPVIVPFPEQIKQPGRYTTILALFIDENGIVRRVRIDGPSLPKPMEDAARDTFLQAHFQPGEVQGQQVKSLIRVEVVFDNTPIEAQALPQS